MKYLIVFLLLWLPIRIPVPAFYVEELMPELIDIAERMQLEKKSDLYLTETKNLIEHLRRNKRDLANCPSLETGACLIEYSIAITYRDHFRDLARYYALEMMLQPNRIWISDAFLAAQATAEHWDVVSDATGLFYTYRLRRKALKWLVESSGQ